MIDGAMFDLLLRSLVLMATSWGFAIAIDRAGASAAMRHAALLFGFVAVALLPILSTVLPDLPVAFLPAAQAAAPEIARMDTPVGAAALPSRPDLLALLYLAVTACLLWRLVAGRMLLSRLWTSASPVEHLPMLEILARRFDVRREIAVRISTGPTVPMTWGIFRPRILLPAEAVGWSAEQWRVVLLHELGHVARHDSSVRTFAAVLCALYWMNPAIWFAAARMRREQEHACDDLVLSNGADAAVYARNLLAAARSFQAPRACLAAAMIGRSDLERRLVAIVGDVSRSGAGRRFVASGAAAALSAASLAAAVVPVPAEAPEAPAAPRASAFEAPAAPAKSALAEAEAPAPAPPADRPVHSSHTAAAPRAIVAEAAAPAVAPHASDYQAALARYRDEKARYLEDLGAYRAKMGAYQAAMDQHRRDLAEHRRLVEAVRALPEGDPNKLVPPGPVAPVAPVAPTAPTVPPVPPAYDHS